MNLRSAQLEAFYVRRREQEFNRVQKTQALSRYYDHWEKQNSRYENWTAPEYYNKVEEQLKQKREKGVKQQQLQERQSKLKDLIISEKLAYDIEVERLNRPRSRLRRVNADTDTLERVDQNVKQRENLRRKLELEAKLFGKLRHGVDDENAIFKSKTDNEVMAKLNWLDKQIEEQLLREKEEAATQERTLRMQEEMVKYEQTQKERQMLREKEIREMRALQERHMEELKKRQQEGDLLKAEERHMRMCQQELEKEFELLEESTAATSEPTEFSQAYNLNKIKVIMRKRSELFRGQIKLCMGILERTRLLAVKTDVINSLYEKYKQQLEAERHTVSQIEAMYESEAKYNLQRCEDTWQMHNTERYHELKQLLLEVQSCIQGQLNENLQQQSELIDIRTAHLSAIDNSNEKLKLLIKEQEDSPRFNPSTQDDGVDCASIDAPITSNRRPVPRQSTTSAAIVSPRSVNELQPTTSRHSGVSRLSNSFNNLNLDVWKDIEPPTGVNESPRMQSARSMQVVTADNAERPRFARKRVAWT